MQKKKISGKNIFFAVAVIIVMIAGLGLIFLSGALFGAYLGHRNHWSVATVENTFTESAKVLKNPNRGFYSMYGFAISDAKQNYAQELAQKMYQDENMLSLIQINLREYKNRPITQEGLENIDALFKALQKKEKQYIVRFLYDWNGKAEETEPEDVELILQHMSQLEKVLDKYSSCIFTFQGIFVGDCGEMHGSVHMEEESMKLLLQRFSEVTPENTYLSVRTPQHWRVTTGMADAGGFGTNQLSLRLGLYNDGMMGTEQDTGTYGTASKEEAGVFGKWSREEELIFQEELCKLVPNGGEVIIDNPVNDFQNAIDSLGRMHVTYLNSGYDMAVLNKWAEYTVTEPGCYHGMDGLNYVERHLGYRLLITNSALNYKFWPDQLELKFLIQNVGFAPLYKEPELYITICRRDTQEVVRYPVEAQLRSLAGGREANLQSTISKEISLAGYAAGEYDVFFSMKDVESGRYLELANEQEMQEHGYLLGCFSLGELKKREGK